ncbi:MAG: DUF1501 domain-containing protein [Actinobacteria bacterium]|nr:DUF1501 domain-containing protein [Actinomycetota bacterium]
MMLDPDISTQDALRLLTVRDEPMPDDVVGMDRRRFLQMMGWGVGAGAALGTLGEVILPSMVPDRLREAWAASPVGPNDGILVLIGLFGGSDGLNVVVPYNNGAYYQQHGALAIPAGQVLPLDGQVGLHPNLPYLKSLYDSGDVAVVQGVGYPNPDLSHFSSMATWMDGGPISGMPTSGWIGRWLDGLAGDDLFRAATVGQGLPLHLVGNVKRGTAIPQWGIGFGGGSDQHDLWMYNAVRAMSAAPAGRGQWHDAVATSMRGVIDVGQMVGPVFDQPLPDGDLVKKMTVAARLINADLGLRVVDTGYDGFDTHSSQPGNLVSLLSDLDAALAAFFAALDPRFRSRVTVMTYSEFGRTSWANDSSGTDHGTVNNHFVVGAGVKGGLYGQQPNLAGLGRWDRMGFNVDFRSLYATVLDGWMGGGSSSVLGANYPNLGFFDQAPGVSNGGNGVSPPTQVGDYVGVNPARLYDSRTADRLAPLGPGTTVEVSVLGRGGVPAAGVTAVVLNVVSVNASGGSSFCVWPKGEAKPNVANVTVPVGFATGSLVVSKVGAGGRVNITNESNSADCVVDVVGYFGTATASRLQSITPFRALDTRNGTGGRLGALGPNTAIDLAVRGVGGVPGDADAVVVNVTAVAPTAFGYVTVWPSGEARPFASSLNFPSGAAVPNMVVAKIGANGKIGVFNANGNTHIVVDVVGYMSATAPGRYYPLPAARVWDTRTGGNSPAGPGTTVTLPVLGVGGVPASGVSGVALVLAAKGPTQNTFVTAWPSGVAKPYVSSLNPRVGVDVSNLTFVKVGGDGAVQVYNENGLVNLVVDIVGYFTG